MAKRSLLHDPDLRGSARTLVSSYDSQTSSRSNVNTFTSSSYGSRIDVQSTQPDTDMEQDDEEDDEDDERGRQKGEDIESDRGLWERRWHYIFLGFGAIFGVRNVLQFPALALEHGGGAFVFCYVMLTFTIGLPLIYMEISLGQYARGGLVKAWRILPLARGISVGSLLLLIFRSSYTSTSAAWSLYYLYSSLLHLNPATQIRSPNDLPNTTLNINESALFHQVILNKSRDYFYSSVLETSNSIVTMGRVLPHILIPIFLLWMAAMLLTSLGPRIMGKISLLFTLLPSFLLFIIFIGICTMPGSVVGIQAFLNPRWNKLSHFKPWLDALDFVLTGMACGTGILITLSGHCNFHINTFRSAMFMNLMSLTMTMLCGCLSLSLLGVQARNATVSLLENVALRSDLDLGFIYFPTTASELEVPVLWSCLFYLSIVIFSVVGEALSIYTVHQGIMDFWHLDTWSLCRKLGLLAAVTCSMAMVSLTTTAQNGLYVSHFLRLAVQRVPTPVLCAAQCAVVAWGYGARRFAGRITEMTGKNKSFMWKFLWRWGCPCLLSLVTVVSLLTTNLLRDLPIADGSRTWLYVFGWCVTAAILLPGAIMAMTSFFKKHGTFKQRLKQLRITPSTWGPGHPEHEPQADLPDYVICHPDPFRPANALAMLTANLYLPNIVNFNSMNPANGPENGAGAGFLSDAATPSSSDEEDDIDLPPRKDGCMGRWHATIVCLRHVVGLGNFVRFPYLAYKHDGGAFVLAYSILLLTCGLPLVVLETAIGQFSTLGPINVWKASPLFKGNGISMVSICVVTSIYYSTVTSWSLFYLATSLTSVTPWEKCDDQWKSNSCSVVNTSSNFCSTSNSTNASVAASGCHIQNNATFDNNRTSVEEYFYLFVLKTTGSWDEVGPLSWQVALCLLMTWIMIFLALTKGGRPGANASFVMLVLTSNALLILSIRSSSLLGGHDGLSHLFTVNWSQLTSSGLWKDAGSQVFFSLSLGSGTLISVGTYNKFTNNIFREAGMLCVVDTVVSLMTSLVVFSVIGSLAHATGRPIEEMIPADLGVTFVSLSHAVLQLPWPLLWSILTFLTLFVCGLCTCVSAMSMAVSAIMDILGSNRKKQRIWFLMALVCGCLLVSLPLSTQVGFLVISALDAHLSGIPQAFVSGAIIVAFIWIYGINRFCGDVSRMLSSTVSWWWRFWWVIGTPCCIMLLLLASLISEILGDDPIGSFSWWGQTIGILLALAMVAPIVVGFIHEMNVPRSGGLMERFQKSCQPRKAWGATLHRCMSNIEYYPTVHTHIGPDILTEGLTTITDHVEFTTVGVRVPSLSQTTLLPVSPSGCNTKKPANMRQKAILNHAYSNPQCNISNGSLDRAERGAKKGGEGLDRQSHGTSGKVKRKSKKKRKPTCHVATQTEHGGTETRLKRQRSQPLVRVTRTVPLLARSMSWHQIPGSPAVLEVSTKQHARSPRRPAKSDSKLCKRSIDNTKPCKAAGGSPVRHTEGTNVDVHAETLPTRHRRFGQSVAPNLNLLLCDKGNNNECSTTCECKDLDTSPELTPSEEMTVNISDHARFRKRKAISPELTPSEEQTINISDSPKLAQHRTAKNVLNSTNTSLNSLNTSSHGSGAILNDADLSSASTFELELNIPPLASDVSMVPESNQKLLMNNNNNSNTNNNNNNNDRSKKFDGVNSVKAKRSRFKSQSRSFDAPAEDPDNDVGPRLPRSKSEDLGCETIVGSRSAQFRSYLSSDVILEEEVEKDDHKDILVCPLEDISEVVLSEKDTCIS